MMRSMRNLSSLFGIESRFFKYMFLVILLLSPPLLALSRDSTGTSQQVTPRVGLVLSGGGARGIAHVGAIRALEEAGIPIDYIAGTSMGGIIGGLYAAGYNGSQLQALVDSLNWTAIFSQAPEPGSVWVSKRYGLMEPIVQLRFKFWKLYLPTGLINGQRISQELFRLSAAANYAAGGDFDSLGIPFRAVSVNIATGKAITLEKGGLAQAMRSSMAIPLLFYPAVYDDQLMVDGGVLKVLPTDVARQMGADVVIAVDVTKPLPGGEVPENLVRVANHTIDIMIHTMEQKYLAYANVVIQPPVDNHPETSYTGLDTLIRAGYQATMEKMDSIKQLIYRRRLSTSPKVARTDPSQLQQATVSEIRVIGHQLVITDSTMHTGKLPPSNLFKRESLRRKIVLSYFPLKIGDKFGMRKALQGVDNLYATGLFQNVWLELDRPEPDSVRINVHFVENALRTIGFGVNYRSEEGASVFAQIVPFSFLGSGTLIMPLVRYGELRTRAGLEISNGRLLSTPLPFYIGLYYDKEQPFFYNTTGEKIGQLRTRHLLGQAAFGVQPSKRLLMSLGVRADQVQSAELIHWNTATTTRRGTMFGQLLMDTRNHPHFPTIGSYLTLEAQLSTNLKRFSNRYSKISARFDTYLHLTNRHIVYLTGYLGASSGLLPRYEQFRLGGPNELPGYHRNEQWNNNMLVTGLSYRWELLRFVYWQTNWRIGNVYTQIQSVRPNNLLTGVSTGLRIASPLGPLSLYYGWNNIDRRQIYFSMGYDF